MEFKIATTFISIAAGVVLIYFPRGWWKVTTIFLAICLVFVQGAAWVALP